jgi:hypothetical protein
MVTKRLIAIAAMSVLCMIARTNAAHAQTPVQDTTP